MKQRRNQENGQSVRGRRRVPGRALRKRRALADKFFGEIWSDALKQAEKEFGGLRKRTA